MSQKNKKSEKKSPKPAPGRSSEDSDPEMPVINPFAVTARNIKANNEAKQPPPHEAFEMADSLKVRSGPDVKLKMASSSKSASNQLDVPQTRQARRFREIEIADSDPPIEASQVTRNIKATNEAKQPPPHEAFKMADNWDHLKDRSGPDVKLPMASSSKSASNQLDVLPTRHARLFKEAILGRENAGSDPPIEASQVVAPKRSATPLPSYFEANHKKMKIATSHLPFDNPKPKASDATLPVPVAASKQLKKARLELNQNKENAKKRKHPTVVKDGTARSSLSQGKGRGPAPKSARSAAGFEEAHAELTELSARGLLGPSGEDISFLEQFHQFFAEHLACNEKNARRVLKLETSNTKQYYENVALQSRLKSMTETNKNLEHQLALDKQLTIELHGKYLDALKARTTVEMEAHKHHERATSLIDQQRDELKKHQTEVESLVAELKNMQATNREFSTVLENLQKSLKNSEETASKLSNQNSKKADELEKLKLKIQKDVAEREEIERQYAQQEHKLMKMTQECNELKVRQVDYEALQLQNDIIANELQTVQTNNNFLNERIQELEAARTVLIDINEDYSKELPELKAENVAYNDTISVLRATVAHKEKDINELAESNKQQSEELQKYKAQHMVLEVLIKDLENKQQDQTQSLKAEQENLIKEIQKGEALKAGFEGEKERYQADIDALKTALKHRDKESCAEQAKMQGLEAELEELRKINASLLAENEQKDNDILAAKAAFDQEIKQLTDNLKNKISGLQDDLKQKEIKLVGLEHEKNGIINQLKNKMSTICNTIEQPIIASALPKTPEPGTSLTKPKKSQEVKPTGSQSPARSSKKRKTSTKFDVINIESDFESEDEIPLKILFSKRENLAVVKPQDSAFDALKKKTP